MTMNLNSAKEMGMDFRPVTTHDEEVDRLRMRLEMTDRVFLTLLSWPGLPSHLVSQIETAIRRNHEAQ